MNKSALQMDKAYQELVLERDAELENLRKDLDGTRSVPLR